MVRDPRDMLVSAVRYHRTSNEGWLHKPGPNGKTYKETINAMSDEDAYLFEIDGSTGKELRRILDFKQTATIKLVHYEDYVTDRNLCKWRDLLEWAGLRSADLILAQQALYEHSLFGMQKKGGHVRSGNSGQWRDKLSDKVLLRLDDRFPNLLREMGYDQSLKASQQHDRS
ncbi:MAG: sulfotransferase domain-containing protein [Pseudomonadota bacterium]